MIPFLLHFQKVKTIPMKRDQFLFRAFYNLNFEIKCIQNMHFILKNTNDY